MDRNIKEIKQKLAKYEKLEVKWAEERELYQKSIALMQEEITKCKLLNANLMKKNKHKRTSSDDQMFIFNQTNISSYYPVLVLPTPVNWVPRANLRSHLDSVRALCWQGHFLLSAGEDCLLKIWERDQLRITVRQHLAPIYTICGDSEKVFTGGAEGVIRQWDVGTFLENSHPVNQLQCHDDSIWQLCWNTKTKNLISSSSDSTLKMFRCNDNTMQQISKIQMGSDSPTSITSINNDRVVSGSVCSQKLKIFDFQKKFKICDLNYQSKQVCSQANKVLYWNNRGIVVSAHEDRAIRFFDLNSGKCIKCLVAHSDAVTSLCFNNSEPQEMYSISHDGTFRGWDLREFRCISDVAVHMQKYDESALTMCHNEDEKTVAVGGADGQIKLLCPQQ